MLNSLDVTNTIDRLYKNGSCLESLAYSFYVDGTYTKGELVKINYKGNPFFSFAKRHKVK